MGTVSIRYQGIVSQLSRWLGAAPVLFLAACSGGDEQGDVEAGSSAVLTCEGSCPVHVDPGAPEAGDGSSWTSPLRSVQAAVDAQEARGGGEVWVRQGGPFETLAGDPDVTLIELRGGVALLGGFAGTETNADERDPAARTLIAGAPFGEAFENAPLIVGGSDSTLDGFTIIGQHGPALELRNVTGVRVSNVEIEDGYVYRAGLVDVADSEAAFVGVSVRDSTTSQGVPGIFVARSTLQIVDSEFSRSRAENGGSAGIHASSSRLVLDGVRFLNNSTRAAGQSAGLHATDSDVLVLSSAWLGNTGDRGSIDAVASRLVAVSSHWEGNLHTAATVRLQGGSGVFLNSSFVGNSSFGGGIVSGRDSDLQIVNSTFADNEDTYPGPNDKPDDVSFTGSSALAFWNSFSNRGAQSILQPFAGSGNCLLDGVEPYRRAEEGLTQVLLRSDFACTNRGNNAAARAAARRARRFALALGATTPLSGDWWRASSSVFEVELDTGRVDPGRHYAPLD